MDHPVQNLYTVNSVTGLQETMTKFNYQSMALENSRSLTENAKLFDRYFDKWRGTSDYSPAMDAVATALAAVTSTPTAVAAGGVGGASAAASAAAAAAASRRRWSLSTEDVSGLELTDCHHHADTAATTAGDTSRGSSKRASVSPHPQVHQKEINLIVSSADL